MCGRQCGYSAEIGEYPLFRGVSPIRGTTLEVTVYAGVYLNVHAGQEVLERRLFVPALYAVPALELLGGCLSLSVVTARFCDVGAYAPPAHECREDKNDGIDCMSKQWLPFSKS